MFERYTSKLLLTPRTSLSTSFGNYIFDCYIGVDHTSDSVITSHPVQTGANISDHKYRMPNILVFHIKMSDTAQDLIAGQFGKSVQTSVSAQLAGSTNVTSNTSWLENLGLLSQGEITNVALLSEKKLEAIKKDKSLNVIYTNSRSVNAYHVLETIKNSNVIFECYTRLKHYENMTIKTIQAHEDNTTAYGGDFIVICQEVLTADVATVTVSVAPQTTNTTEKGLQNSQPLESVLQKQQQGILQSTFTLFRGFLQ